MNKKILIIVAVCAAVLLGLFVFLKCGRGLCPLTKGKSGVSLSGMLNQARDLQNKGDLLGSRDAYVKLLNEFTNSNDALNWQRKVEELNIKLLFSPAVTPKSVAYEIKPGDTLTKIAREFKTTPELIAKSNNLTDSKIMPGRKIKVWNAPFSILVDKSQNTLTLKSDEEVIKVYIVSTGKNNSTPVGTYKITNKLVNPTWFKAGAVIPAGSTDNVLGTRWMGFDLAGYGIHGTTEPQNLGKQVTAGCVRLGNSDVEELYTIVPTGTEVTIVD
ncbi:MAG: L,D-transpeptidase family protein [Candidatus Omnitrophica bacterium]|nr:L,D-transpeptidase family protein [Candidatus Omnitrophota bacterium]